MEQSGMEHILSRLAEANRAFALQYPGESENRQPVHTVYGGAHLFRWDTIPKLGTLAERSLIEYAPNFITFAQCLGLPGAEGLKDSDDTTLAINTLMLRDAEAVRASDPAAWLAHTVYSRVWEKLKREAVEDFRIDFEDGFGNRPDAEEDAVAQQAARELAKGMAEGSISPFIGIRIKPFTEELKRRSFRTLELFVRTLTEETGGKLPENFVVTLPKVTLAEHVSALVACFELLEETCGLPKESLKLEIMVETPQSIISPTGEIALSKLVAAGIGRCVAAHFGTYDYTASVNITAAYQTMDHPACDYARSAMKVALAGTGVWLSDGATNVMPVGPHRASEGNELSGEQRCENVAAVHSAWKLGYDHIRHSLRHGFYQGWDLHPAQFPIRYAACYAFFLEGLAAASDRLRNFVDKAAQATLVGNVFDDAATGQGLLNYFLRALNCGAITEQEIADTGLTLDEVRSRSFVKILDARRAAAAK
jgi:citrate lyase beta subunit